MSGARNESHRANVRNGARNASLDPLKREVERPIVLAVSIARLSAPREPFCEKDRHGGFSRRGLRQLLARYCRAVSVSWRAPATTLAAATESTINGAAIWLRMFMVPP